MLFKLLRPLAEMKYFDEVINKVLLLGVVFNQRYHEASHEGEMIFHDFLN